MGVMLEANTNPEKRAELFLDRIRRGQFESLERYTTKDLREIERQAARAYAALPESRSTDRGKVGLVWGRVGKEANARMLGGSGKGAGHPERGRK